MRQVISKLVNPHMLRRNSLLYCCFLSVKIEIHLLRTYKSSPATLFSFMKNLKVC